MAAEPDQLPAQAVSRVALQQNVVRSQYCSPRQSRLRSNLCRTASGLGCAAAAVPPAAAVSGHASVAPPRRVVNSRRRISHSSEPVRAAAYRDHRYLKTGASGLVAKFLPMFFAPRESLVGPRRTTCCVVSSCQISGVHPPSNRCSRQKGRGFARSLFQAKNDPNDAPDFLKPLRIEREGYINPAICCPIDVEHQPRGGELDQAKPEVPGIPVGLMRLYIADAAIVVLKLALNEEVGLEWR
jgi:hypothetical protein